MIQRKENIDAALQDLKGWLEAEIRESPLGRTFTADDGLRISPHLQSYDRSLTIDVRWTIGENPILVERYKAISFELRKLNEHRTQVIGICAIPQLDPYFERIWSALLDTYGSPSTPVVSGKTLTPNEVIATFYRRHSHNKKITLKQVCDDLGVNYDSIRVAKVAYDKRRRRKGSD